MRAIPKTIYFYFSTALHLIALLAMSMLFKPNVSLLGEPNIKTVDVYFAHEQITQPATVTEKKRAQQEQKVENHKQENSLALQKNVIKTRAAKNQTRTQKASTQQTNSNGGQTETLVALLHNAIQRHQQYPYAAEQMERQGRVKVGFILYPNGSVTHLKLLASSGTTSLDQAALAAVSSTAPFKQAKDYLDAPQEFSIDVVFELT